MTYELLPDRDRFEHDTTWRRLLITTALTISIQISLMLLFKLAFTYLGYYDGQHGLR